MITKYCVVDRYNQPIKVGLSMETAEAIRNSYNNLYMDIDNGRKYFSFTPPAPYCVIEQEIEYD